MLEKLKQTFEICGVDYETIADNEIIVPCPLNLLHHTLNADLPAKYFVDNGENEKIYNVDWEAKIHITETNGELSWLITSSCMGDNYEI